MEATKPARQEETRLLNAMIETVRLGKRIRWENVEHSESGKRQRRTKAEVDDRATKT